MNPDDFITIDSEAASTADCVTLPANYVPVGSAGHDDVKIYIRSSVYSALREHTFLDEQHEVGAFLVGNYVDGLSSPQVVISDCILAEYTDATVASLTFTHDTWNHVHREMDTHFSGKRIIGWQHSHPGYGIFLSSYDLFIHENFFNAPFQIAYVIDPVQNTEGFFQWRNGKVVPAGGFYIYDEPGKRIKPDLLRKNRGAGKKKKRGKALLTVLISVLIAAAILAAVILQPRTQEKQDDQPVPPNDTTMTETEELVPVSV